VEREDIHGERNTEVKTDKCKIYFWMYRQWRSCLHGTLILVRTTNNAFGWVTKEIKPRAYVSSSLTGFQA
jgi:hypothetical protein